MNHLKVGKQIQYLRKKNHITQQQLADIMSVTPAAVSKWENNASIPDIEMLCSLADYFQVSLDYVMGRDNKSPGAVIVYEKKAFMEETLRVASDRGIVVYGSVNDIRLLEKLMVNHREEISYIIHVFNSGSFSLMREKVISFAEQEQIKLIGIDVTEPSAIPTVMSMLLDTFR